MKMLYEWDNWRKRSTVVLKFIPNYDVALYLFCFNDKISGINGCLFLFQKDVKV